jgi:hypothetical protein
LLGPGDRASQPDFAVPDARRRPDAMPELAAQEHREGDERRLVLIQCAQQHHRKLLRFRPRLALTAGLHPPINGMG